MYYDMAMNEMIHYCIMCMICIKLLYDTIWFCIIDDIVSLFDVAFYHMLQYWIVSYDSCTTLYCMICCEK